MNLSNTQIHPPVTVFLQHLLTYLNTHLSCCQIHLQTFCLLITQDKKGCYTKYRLHIIFFFFKSAEITLTQRNDFVTQFHSVGEQPENAGELVDEKALMKDSCHLLANVTMNEFVYRQQQIQDGEKKTSLEVTKMHGNEYSYNVIFGKYTLQPSSARIKLSCQLLTLLCIKLHQIVTKSQSFWYQVQFFLQKNKTNLCVKKMYSHCQS